MVVFLWLWWCFCGGVVVFLWWCGGVLVVMLSGPQHKLGSAGSRVFGSLGPQVSRFSGPEVLRSLAHGHPIKKHLCRCTGEAKKQRNEAARG